jgi:hypothetical protein
VFKAERFQLFEHKNKKQPPRIENEMKTAEKHGIENEMKAKPAS